MHVTEDFKDLLELLEKYKVRYLIIGEYAFAFHAFPRYTKDLDILVDCTNENIERVNKALAEFGSPVLFERNEQMSILQIGVVPNRIDILLKVDNIRFATAWKEMIREKYGDITVNWIGLNSLIRSKSNTGQSRHDEDVKVLKKIRKKTAES